MSLIQFFYYQADLVTNENFNKEAKPSVSENISNVLCSLQTMEFMNKAVYE